ncbi:SF1B family DNA helicase RecD2 [Alkalicoccus luteus]|uniref:ATP-dependent RecD2 DNA helicase n=1 Tax=Alkalicoccus luteus TaxID=1237094 RepID=A0A969PNJ2_9BACI|nr:ATP-dependent RecD-like DNA helicase [Alkalicoccus luteus]NJP36553.1 ATP-dependent RecD-like DNA helicase [Alkalicoccus luteus]
MEEKEFVKGEISHVIYHQEDSLYTVAKLKIIQSSEELTEKETVVVGLMAKPDRETVYTFSGFMKEHPRFGKQFAFDTYKKEMPDTHNGLMLYFSSDRFPGIGKKTASAIVEAFGTNAISMILEKPSRLAEIPKLDSEKADLIYKQLQEDQGIEEVLMRLYEYGFGLKLSVKIYQTYQTDALRIIEENPYQMVGDVEGVGFIKADQLGQKQGVTGDHPDRLKAAVLYVLYEQSLNEGHVFVKLEHVLEGALELLTRDGETIDAENLGNVTVELNEEEKVVLDEAGGRLYIPSLFYAEQGIATNLNRLLRQEKPDDFPDAELDKALGKVEDTHNITYAPSQKLAVETAVSASLMMLTGGPGTGKTTVIKGVLEVFAELHGLSLNRDDYRGNKEAFPFMLAAPTGRAAKRMTESTGLQASTIHRLLGYKGSEEEGFDKDEENQLEGRLLILDEMSMVDTWLANQLFKAVPSGMQVLIVGDEDQLPSVGPGQVMTDLLASELIPVVRLTDIYRQSEDSHIITFSHEVKAGVLPERIDTSSRDLRFFPCRTDSVEDAVKKICSGAKAKGYTAKDVQVLAPMYKGPAGITKLNTMLQELFNPKTGKVREVQYGEVVYRKGDVVLQLVNNPEENVFNGDRGEIVAILTEKETTDKKMQIVISFDGTEVTYGRSELSQITHAYCCSIHKSQGSEFPIVVMPVVRSYSRMLRRKLIYTGITRAREFLLLCGEWDALNRAVQAEQELLRFTSLQERLDDAKKENSFDS